MKHYPIDEECRRLVDDAAELARARKEDLPAIYHWKLDRIADQFARELQRVCRVMQDQIKAVGGDGDRISADDPYAIEQLEARLERFEARGAAMRRVNSYYKKYGTLDGCPDINEEEAQALTAAMERGENREGTPYRRLSIMESNTNIRRTRGRLAELLRSKETG